MNDKKQKDLARHPLAEEFFGSLERHEFEGLKQGIAENPQGVQVWLYQGHVLCGWHTYLACQELGIEPEYVEVEAKNDDEALLKALSVELRRRSHTEQQRCAIWFRAADKIPLLRASLERITCEAGERKQSGLKRGKEAPPRQPQLEANGKAAKKIGDLLGVSRSVVERDRRLFTLSPEWHAKAAAGVAFDHAFIEASRQDRIEKARSLPPVRLKDIKLLHCDFRELERRAKIKPRTGRLVVLDPPYSAKHVRDYGEVAEHVARWLDPHHGMLVAMVGGLWLPDVLALMTPHLRWHWPGGIFYGGNTHGMRRGKAAHRVRGCQRHCLYFRAADATKPLRVFNDVIECREVEKDWDDWQQPLKAIRHWVEMLTEPHDLVIDTHGGAFTTAVACLLSKRRYVGCDVSAKQIEKGTLRLREVAHELGLA